MIRQVKLLQAFHFTTMSSGVGCTVAAFNGAKYAAPYVKNSTSQNAQEAVGVFFGGNNPEIQFQPQSFDQRTGPTTAFSTTVEARRWDHVINSFLIMEKMHEHQQFPLLLAPLELAKGMKFTTRIFTSNLDPPEEAPEHVPAPFSTTQWSETTTALRMVHRSVKFSLHELKTEKGQQDYKVHLSNLALMFLRDTHNVILRKFARQTTLVQALTSFYPPSKRAHRELMNNVVRNFGMLNTNPAGLDAMVANVKQVGTTQNVDFDTCVVPYGSLSNLALSKNNFILTETAVTLARDLAKMADINHPTKIPTHLFQNEFGVFQYQKNADQIQNPQNDPLANTAVVSTYHPFGSDVNYAPGSRDIQVVSASANGWASLKFDEAVCHLNLPKVMDDPYILTSYNPSNESALFKWGGNKTAVLYGQVGCLWKVDNFNGLRAIVQQLKGAGFNSTELATKVLKFYKVTGNTNYAEVMKKINNVSCEGFKQVMGASSFDDADKTILKNFAALPFDSTSVQQQLIGGINFPFEVVAVRPFIELETANALFCKRGRETAVTYCLPPWSFIGRDNRIEMVDMKFGFWRECHIERPANIIVAEHAFVTRVRQGMDTTWMYESDYLSDPMDARMNGDVFPMITGPFCPGQDLPNMAAIKHQLLHPDHIDTYKALDAQLIDTYDGVSDMNKVWTDNMSNSPTLWEGDSLNDAAIPRICALGTTRQMEVKGTQTSDKFMIESIRPTHVIHNKGHMKELDSDELIGSLGGFAQPQMMAPKSFF